MGRNWTIVTVVVILIDHRSSAYVIGAKAGAMGITRFVWDLHIHRVDPAGLSIPCFTNSR